MGKDGGSHFFLNKAGCLTLTQMVVLVFAYLGPNGIKPVPPPSPPFFLCESPTLLTPHHHILFKKWLLTVKGSIHLVTLYSRFSSLFPFKIASTLLSALPSVAANTLTVRNVNPCLEQGPGYPKKPRLLPTIDEACFCRTAELAAPLKSSFNNLLESGCSGRSLVQILRCLFNRKESWISPYTLVHEQDRSLQEFYETLQVLLKQGYVLEQNNKVQLSPAGIELAKKYPSTLSGMSSMCSCCRTLGYRHTPEALELIERFKKMAADRPTPSQDYDQQYITIPDVFLRIAFMDARGDLAGFYLA